MNFQALQNFELNCFAIIILSLILADIMFRNNRYLIDQELFLVLACLTVLILLLDTAMWVLDGRSEFYVKFIYTFSIVLYNILNPIICIVWYLYVDSYIHVSRKHMKTTLILMIILAFINFVLSIASIFNDIYFVIDDNNIYHRGKYIYILLAICLSIIIYTTIFIIKNKKNLEKREYILSLCFEIPPAIGGIIQYHFYGVIVIWIFVTISILIIFINNQNDQLHKDYLTGLYNRRSLDSYLEQKIKNQQGKTIAGIMIDLNHFKMINDLHGHNNGDEALRHIACILKNTFRKKDFISRYGGDEFVIVIELSEHTDISNIIQRLNKNISDFNSQKKVPYEISVSIGYDCFPSKLGEAITSEEFLKRIDTLMYLDKQNQHIK